MNDANQIHNYHSMPNSSSKSNCAQIFCLLFLYTALNVCCFLWQYMTYTTERNHWIRLSRGLAQICLLNMALLFIPLMQSTSRWLIRANHRLPSAILQHSTNFHQICGCNVVVSGVLHGIFQFCNMHFAISNYTPQEWKQHVLYNAAGFRQPPTINELLGTLPGSTGMYMLLFILVCVPFALPCIRKNFFDMFWYSHIVLYTLFVFLFLVHGTTAWYYPTQAWIWCGIPYALYLMDRRYRFRIFGSSRALQVTNAVIVRRIVHMAIQNTNNQVRRLRPGMFVFLNVPSISFIEWHPFTIASAPSNAFMHFCIDCSGDWTKNLLECLSEPSCNWPKIYVDGPYYSIFQEYEHYEILLFIAAGTGITPIMSVLKHMYSRNDFTHRSHTHVIWCCRSIELFFEFYDFLEECNAISNVSIQLFNTSSYNYVPSDSTFRIIKRGRPNWAHQFVTISNQHSINTVGVFFCGKQQFSRSIQNHCHEFSSSNMQNTGAKFEFHSECFN